MSKLFSKNLQTIFVVCCLLFLVSLFYGCKSYVRAQHKGSISETNFQRLKETTTIFILPENQEEYLEDYNELLPKAWTFTPIKVVRYSDLSKYTESAERFSFFAIGGREQRVTSSNTGYAQVNTHFYLTLSLPTGKQTRKGKIKTDDLCRVELYPDSKTMNSFSRKNLERILYTEGSFRNFTLPYMMAYLRFVQKNIENKKNPWVYDNYSDPQLKTKLAKGTLYVPDSMIFYKNKFSEREALQDEDLFSSYGGKYKFISTSELIQLIKSNPSKPIFLFEYVLSSTDKYVGVLEVNSGTIVYRKYTAVTYNIKSKDIRRILD